jgi:hypothetical protein
MTDLFESFLGLVDQAEGVIDEKRDRFLGMNAGEWINSIEFVQKQQLQAEGYLSPISLTPKVQVTVGSTIYSLRYTDSGRLLISTECQHQPVADLRMTSSELCQLREVLELANQRSNQTRLI